MVQVAQVNFHKTKVIWAYLSKRKGKKCNCFRHSCIFEKVTILLHFKKDAKGFKAD